MTTTSLLSIVFNVSGSLLLAISLNKVIKSFGSSIKALEHFKDSVVAGGDILSFEGLDQHRERASKSSREMVTVGIILLIAGFVCQIIDLLINKTCC